MGRGINALLYVGAIVGGCIATLLLVDAVLSRGSAPQQAAEACLAIGAVVVPYVMARAVAGIRALDGEIPRSRVGDKRA